MRHRYMPVIWLILASRALAQEVSPPRAEPSPSASSRTMLPPDHYVLVEEFTAATLAQGELKIGTDLDVGLTDRLMIGTDVTALLVGAATLQAKALIWTNNEHQISFGLKAAYLDRKSLLWGSMKEHFIELDARIFRPSLSWTNRLSPRLKLHTFWGKGLGTIRLQLSEKGRRKLWEAKHPGDDYEARDLRTQEPRKKDTIDPVEGDTSSASTDETIANSKQNQEKASNNTSSLTSKSMQVQSVTGLAQERFQLTGEFTRTNGNKVLVTSRIEQNDVEDLRSNFFRLTVANQWIWPFFQIRLGVGLQYYVLTGRDLDGELIDSAGVQPASDISFYWRL